MPSRHSVEVEGFYFLMPEPGVEDAPGRGWSEGEALSGHCPAQAHGSAENLAAPQTGCAARTERTAGLHLRRAACRAQARPPRPFGQPGLGPRPVARKQLVATGPANAEALAQKAHIRAFRRRQPHKFQFLPHRASVLEWHLEPLAQNALSCSQRPHTCPRSLRSKQRGGVRDGGCSAICDWPAVHGRESFGRGCRPAFPAKRSGRRKPFRRGVSAARPG